LRDNAQAIAKYLDAKRALERYGVGTIGSEFETQALPSGDEAVVAGDSRAPHEVLDVAPDASDQQVREAYRDRLKSGGHPDTGGDEQDFKRIERAKEALLG